MLISLGLCKGNNRSNPQVALKLKKKTKTVQSGHLVLFMAYPLVFLCTFPSRAVSIVLIFLLICVSYSHEAP